MFTISDSESEPSDQPGETDQSAGGQEMSVPPGHTLTVPQMRLAVGGRQRVNSDSLASPGAAEREADPQGWGPGGPGAGGEEDGAPFRGRSRSAPPALWAAQRYGRQLRRMSDEFDTLLLDKGEMKRVRSAGTARQMRQSDSWWSFLFSHTETDTEGSQGTAAPDRTE